MAIQGVGGSKVYVITGSNRDPRLTSTGQSWANLVTQQKYRLWNEAQKQAMADIQFEQMTFRQKQAIYDAQRKQLLGAIEDAREQAKKLELKEIESRNAVENKYIGEKNIVSRPRTVSSGESGLPTDPIDKRINSAQIRFNSLVGTSEDLNERIMELRGPRGRDADTNEDEINRVTDVLAQVDAQKNALNKQLKEMQTTREKVAKGLIEPPKAGKSVVRGTVRKGTPIDYTAQIAELQAEQQALEKELAGLEVPTIERPDLLGRTREIYGTQFAAPQREPIISPERLSEFRALGMEEYTPTQKEPTTPQQEGFLAPEVEEQQAPAPAPNKGNFTKMMFSEKASGLNNIGKARLAAQTLNDLDQYFPKESQEYTDVRTEILEAYQMQINPKAVKAIKKGEKGQELKEDNKQVQLVKSLFAPEEDATPEKKQAAFVNARKELEKRYEGKELEEALAILVQLMKESEE